ncbi:hypothetical protein NC651_005811 [Populus alba x Populus x berolinensis]|nr:hypothetical protein NC651_004723 [Populus alba x Populus x berolinensis]KAJ6939473.1 hypothetical protein NC651_005811 [Populus alba x Populus x berolinensis]
MKYTVYNNSLILTKADGVFSEIPCQRVSFEERFREASREATAYKTLADYRVIFPQTGASAQPLSPCPRTSFSSLLICYYAWSSVWRLPVDYG